MASAENASVLKGAALQTPPAAVVDPSDPINLILAAFEKDQVGLVQAADRIEACLERQQLLKHMTLCPSLVGVDPHNRGSEGVNPFEVALLAAEIGEVGWSWAECKHATCIAQQPGAVDIEVFNMRLAEGQALAPVEVGEIAFGSIACSHTNQVLRAIRAELPAQDQHLSDGQRFCRTRLEERDAQYARAVREGLPWKVYSWQVRPMYPQVLSLVSNARNVGSTLNRQESEMQTLLRLHTLSAQHSTARTSVSWQSIRRAILRTRPPCAEKLGSMISFIIARSGGGSGEHLQFLAAFHRNFVDASKRAGVPAALYDSLAAFPHHFLAMAFLEAAWTCPPPYLRNRECTQVTAAEVNTLAKALAEETAEGKHASCAGELLCAARVCADRGEANIYFMGIYSLGVCMCFQEESLSASRPQGNIFQ